MKQLMTLEEIKDKIYIIRREKVMLDFDLAQLYGCEVKQLKRAVKRNLFRFPKDFKFELTKDEYVSLRNHFGTLKRGQHAKYAPFAFTEQGVAMLSSVLNSKRAILVNIAIMRAFVQIRKMLLAHKELAVKLAELKQKVGQHDKEIRTIFEVIHRLMSEPERQTPRIGFRG